MDGALRDTPSCGHAFAIGFLILFVFIGTYTYVNFQLIAAPLSLSPMALGLVYFVFLPSMLTTPLAGRVAARFGPGTGIALTLALAIAGLAALLSTSLPIVLAGMALIAVGTFLAQAIATGHVSRTAKRDAPPPAASISPPTIPAAWSAASCSARSIDRFGWPACVAVLIAALARGDGRRASLKAPHRRISRSSIQTANGIINPAGAASHSLHSSLITGLNPGEAKCENSFKSIACGEPRWRYAIPCSWRVAADAASDGVVTVKSDYSVAETVSRIKKDVAKKGIMFFGVIDQAKLGNAAGNEVGPSRLVMFGNPALGTTFITANPEAGLDWPVRVLVYQAADGAVYAAYTDFDWIAKRHGITNRDKEFKMATEVIQSVTSAIRKN